MAFDLEKIRDLFKKATEFIEWIAELIRKKNWVALLLLLAVVLFGLFNPHEWPFHGLLTQFVQPKFGGWYAKAFWVLVGLLVLSAVIIAARAKRPLPEHELPKLSAIKGLLPFGHEDADIFAQLQREQNLKECLQAITADHWRLGVLSGESGAGKTSFLQAGLWPALELREKPKFRCVYVKFSDLDPFESVKRACLKQLQPLELGDDKIEDVDFLRLLSAATQHDATPIVLLFDQFEQFFVHRKRKSDRAPFVQALTKWFAEMGSLPVKILICIRGDFLDRLNELQKAMRYSLSPTQSFRLERFEPDQATEVFCYLAEKEQLEYDRRFIAEMTRQELADTADGLVSPVDIQVLAWMVAGQTAQDGRAFNRTTFQKLGGVDGLLERYLTRALAVRETEARRQSAIKVLLALTDLERNTRAGALTIEVLRQKLGSDITDAELKEAVVWLARSDVRLVSPLSENEEELYELAHERLIPALRRLAGKQLSEADRADQLLDRRVNEWLGGGHAARYLFSWPELRLINKHKRFVTWGKERQAKEELLAASQRRFGWQFAALGVMVWLAVCGWIGWNTNTWQLYLIKGDLHSYGNNLKNKDALAVIAQAFAYSGDSQLVDHVIGRIKGDTYKAIVLIAIAESYAKLGDKMKASALLEKSSALLLKTPKTAGRISDDDPKTIVLTAIAESFAKLGDKAKSSALLLEALKMTERISDDNSKTIAQRTITKSYAKLGESMKDSTLLLEAFKTVDLISDTRSRVTALRAIAESYAKLGESMKDSTLLLEAFKTAELISDNRSRVPALRAIAESYAKLGDKATSCSLLLEALKTTERYDSSVEVPPMGVIDGPIAKLGESMKDSTLLLEALKTAELISGDSGKDEALRAIAVSYAKLGESVKDSTLLLESLKIARRISDDGSKTIAWIAISKSYARLGDKDKSSALLLEAFKLTRDVRSGITVLRAIAESYAKLGDKAKASKLLLEALKMAELLSSDYDKADALRTIAESYAILGLSMKDNTLLLESLKTAEMIGDDDFKVLALLAIVESSAKLAESSNDRVLYDNTFRFVEGVDSDATRDKILRSILVSKLSITNVGRLRSLTSHFSSEAGKAKALARILMACSHPELIGQETEGSNDL